MMANNSQLGAAKTISVLVTIVPALGMSYILFRLSILSERNSLIAALINMTIFGMVSIFYYFAIGSINSVLFRIVGRANGSKWPKTLASAGAALLWITGLVSSIIMFTA